MFEITIDKRVHQLVEVDGQVILWDVSTNKPDLAFKKGRSYFFHVPMSNGERVAVKFQCTASGDITSWIYRVGAAEHKWDTLENGEFERIGVRGAKFGLKEKNGLSHQVEIVSKK